MLWFRDLPEGRYVLGTGDGTDSGCHCCSNDDPCLCLEPDP